MKHYLLAAILLLASCGGGSKGNTIKNNFFSLEKVTNLTPGTVFESNLSDDSSFGYISIKNLPETVLNGIVVTPQTIHFRHTNSAFGSGALYPLEEWEMTLNIETATKNLISYKKFVYFIGMGPTINCVSTSPYHYPAQVKLNDMDITPSFSCDNNISLAQGNWHTEDAGNGLLNFIIKSKTIDIASNIIDETMVYTLDTQGNIVSFSINGLKSFVAKTSEIGTTQSNQGNL